MAEAAAVRQVMHDLARRPLPGADAPVAVIDAGERLCNHAVAVLY
jgi:hypothetical protein